jgi:protein associated with RNAse G/E
MMTVIKKGPQGEATVSYQGEVIALPSAHACVIRAIWSWPDRDLGYVHLETGDCFTEYYYTDRWFNIFEIARASGERKGWYCNIAEPAVIQDGCIEQVDLLLDVWVDPQGRALLLDEDEFNAVTTLSAEQRQGARQGLRELLEMIERREGPFAEAER